MFAALRRNKTWLWGILIIVVIISFVIFFSPDVNLKRSEGDTAIVAYMDGKPVTQGQFHQAYTEASIFYFLNNGQWPQDSRGWNAEAQAKQRLFLKDRAAKQGITATPQAAAVWLQSLPYFKDKDGNYSPAIYERALTNFAKAGISRYMLEDYARSEIAIKQLMASFGLPGAMVSPRSAKANLADDKETIVAELAVFPTTNYLEGVNVNETNLTRFYTNRMASYRIPDKVKLHYVKFDSTNYVEEGIKRFEAKQKMTLDEFADKVYKESDADSFKDDDGNVLSEADAKVKITDEIKKSTSLQAARNAARDFVNPCFEAEKLDEEDYLAAAKAANLTVTDTEPFARNESIEGLDLPYNFSQSAFQLSKTNAITTPVMGTTNVYVFCFAEKIPGKNPEYADVAEKVLEDYKKQESGTAARTAARNFARTLTNSLAGGKAFDAICDEAKVQHIALPEFTANATGVDAELPVAWMSLRNSISQLKAGDVSSMIPGAEASCIAYVKERKPADQATIDGALKDYLREGLYDNLSTAFQEWFSVEYAKADVKTKTDIDAAARAEQEKAEREAKAAAEEAAAKAAAATSNAAPAAPSTPAAPAAPAATNAPAAAAPAAK